MFGKGHVYVFIDASNIWQAQKAKGQFFDYEKLRRYLKERYKAKSIKVYYYTAFPTENMRDYDLEGRHKFFVYLKKGLGFEVIKKPLKRIYDSENQDGLYIEKGDMDVEITIDAIHNKNLFETAIFFTGDSDFLSLVTYLKNDKKKVYIYSSNNNISKELRTGSDGYTDVLKIEEDIWRNKIKHRKKNI